MHSTDKKIANFNKISYFDYFFVIIICFLLLTPIY